MNPIFIKINGLLVNISSAQMIKKSGARAIRFFRTFEGRKKAYHVIFKNEAARDEALNLIEIAVDATIMKGVSEPWGEVTDEQ